MDLFHIWSTTNNYIEMRNESLSYICQTLGLFVHPFVNCPWAHFSINFQITLLNCSLYQRSTFVMGDLFRLSLSLICKWFNGHYIGIWEILRLLPCRMGGTECYQFSSSSPSLQWTLKHTGTFIQQSYVCSTLKQIPLYPTAQDGDTKYKHSTHIVKSTHTNHSTHKVLTNYIKSVDSENVLARIKRACLPTSQQVQHSTKFWKMQFSISHTHTPKPKLSWMKE